MRIDLTVCTAAGDDVDLTVVARRGTAWRELAGPVGAAVGAVPQWGGGRRLGADDELGRAPLVAGAVLGVDRPMPAASARLEVVGGAGCGAGVALRPGTLTIGRDSSCDLVLADPLVSRRHARLEIGASGVTVRDLDSTGGTFVDGARVATAQLASGVPVRLGAGFVAITGLGTTQPPPAPAEIEVPTRPSAAPRARIPLVAALVPTALGGGLAAATGSWELLAFAVLTPVATLAAALGDRLSARRHARRASRAHRHARERADAEIAARLRAEATARRAELDHPAGLLRTLGLQVAARPRDAVTVVVRVGLGTAPARLRHRSGGEVGSAGRVPDVPLAVDLAAPVVVTGPADVRRDLVRWIAVQVLAAAPGEVALEWAAPPHTEPAWLDRVPTADPSTAARRLTIRTGTDHDDVTVARPGEADPLPTLVEVHADGAVRVLAHGEPPVEGYADRVDPGLAARLARAVARRASTAPAGVPAACRLVELLDVSTADDLDRRWRADDGTARTVLGLAADGAVSVDLDRDGPHLLVAGSTGSGKSELLQCLVAGLAATCSPALLSFLLVDFKGGAAFAECARLPHTVGLVTDLDAAAGTRVLAWLDAELRRRERLFAAAQVSDLTGYRRAHRLDRLVVAVDEFAALADELPAFVPGLVGIARRGRSLGVHLVLATQRPAGAVSQEIRANTALRICLRVTSATDSTDVIDSPAAAGIAGRLAGRAYLRSTEKLREVQIGGVSGRYAAMDEIRVVRRDAPGGRDPAGTDGATDLQRLVETARAAADPIDRADACGPWLPPLAPLVGLAELPPAPAGQLAVGVVDLPAQQRQPALILDMSAGGVMAVAGAARSGRSSALVTVATAAAAAMSPERLQVYGIDAAGRGLAPLRRLPHTGTVAALGDGFGFVALLIERLGELFASAQRGACLLIAVDGWDQLVAASDEYDAGRTAERLVDLARRAASGAATVVVAGGRAVLSPRLGAPAQHRLVLPLGDASDYQLAGVPATAVPPRPTPGRAVRVADAAAVQFALAQPPPIPATAREASALRLRPLPGKVALDDLPRRTGRVTLGVAGDRAAPVHVDLGAGGTVLVCGPPRSGRTTVLRSVLAQSSAVGLVIAPARSPLTAAARLAGVPVLAPSAAQWTLPDTGAVLVDDVEQCADRPLGDDLARWAASGRPLVAAGRSDALAVGYRGLVAQLRSSGAGLVLQPAPGDGDLLGVAITRSREPLPPGRGVLVPDPAWGLGMLPLPVQVAAP